MQIKYNVYNAMPNVLCSNGERVVKPRIVRRLPVAVERAVRRERHCQVPRKLFPALLCKPCGTRYFNLNAADVRRRPVRAHAIPAVKVVVTPRARVCRAGDRAVAEVLQQAAEAMRAAQDVRVVQPPR